MITFADLTEENLKDTPEWDNHPFSCKYCLYWESQARIENSITIDKDKALSLKIDWLIRTKKSFGSCGTIIYLDNKAVGYAQYAPAAFLPNIWSYATGLVNPETVCISCLFIPDKRLRRSGLGTGLLNEIITELKARDRKTVVTIARKDSPDNPSGPMEFYLKNGFFIAHDDPCFPLMTRGLTTNERRKW
ncbi:GNAT family N-acetyltransferase [bacterium]|nr:GNAT family N-acetyltransferase [bacterium]